MRAINTPPLAAFWSWVVDGTRTSGTQEECVRCGLGRVSSTYTARHRRHTSFGAPWRLLRTLLDHRSREPVPLLYLEVILVAGAIGIFADVFIALPWWIPPLTALVLTWLYFLASAFTGPRRRSLERDVRIAMQPGRALELYDAETEAAFRDPPFPLLGLGEAWRGDRWLGGFAKRNGQISELHLGHSEETSDGQARLTVGVQLARPRRGEHGDEDIDVTLAALSAAPRLVRPPDAWSADGDTTSEARLAPSSPLVLPVDGTPVELRTWRSGENWVVVGRVADRIITVDAERIEPEMVSLLTVSEIEPYVAGARLWQVHHDH